MITVVLGDKKTAQVEMSYTESSRRTTWRLRLVLPELALQRVLLLDYAALYVFSRKVKSFSFCFDHSTSILSSSVLI